MPKENPISGWLIREEAHAEILDFITSSASSLSAHPIDSTLASRSNKWTDFEILGHCCDGTTANTQRLIRCKSKRFANEFDYHAGEWIDIQPYTELDWTDLVNFWRIGNIHLANLFCSFSDELTNLQIAWGSETRSCLWLYHHHFVRHMPHHLSQILGISSTSTDKLPAFNMDGSISIA